MQLLNLIPHDTLIKHLSSPVWDSLGEINDIQLDALPTNDNDFISWGSYSGHVSWTVAVIVIALAATLIYIIYLLNRNKLITPITTRDQACNADSDETPGPDDSDITTQRQSVIYTAPTGLVSLTTDGRSHGTMPPRTGNFFELQRMN